MRSTSEVDYCISMRNSKQKQEAPDSREYRVNLHSELNETKIDQREWSFKVKIAPLERAAEERRLNCHICIEL